MQKRGIFSLVLLLILLPLAAEQNLFDLGTAEVLVIATTTAEAEEHSASSVSVIVAEEHHAETTGELAGRAIGVSYSSTGSLGALQSVEIRGATSSKNLIFLDGMPLTGAHDGTVDLSSIPLSIIDRIEIVKSGPGNLGRTNAIGGMVNIITKKGAKLEHPFSITFENGSFLPMTGDWKTLVDSQKIDLTYTGSSMVATAGVIRAKNAYPYKAADPMVRENAQLYEGHGGLTVAKRFADGLKFSNQNLVTYKHLGLPGSLTYELTPNDYQNDLNLSTIAKLEKGDLSSQISYNLGRTLYHDDDYADSLHTKHKFTAQLKAAWSPIDLLNLDSDLLYSIDAVDSTDIGKNQRHTIALSTSGRLEVKPGVFTVHPSLNLAYISDLKALSPNASLGAIHALGQGLLLKASVSYAENVPSFSQLYWPYMGNPDLKTEKGLNTEFGFSLSHPVITYEGTLFTRDITNEISYDSFWIPQNIAHSFYLGMEHTVDITLSEAWSFEASYLLTRSFDLTLGQTLSDGIALPNVRKHTAKGVLSYTAGMLRASVGMEYLGKTTLLTQAFLLSADLVVKPTELVEISLAVDNLLNTAYELTAGFPMPGMKIRVGATLRY